MLLTKVMNLEEKHPPMGETWKGHMKNREERDLLGFWEISKKLWRENWWWYLSLFAIGMLPGIAIGLALIILRSMR